MDFICEERDLCLLHQPAPPHDIIGRVQFLGEEQVEIFHRSQRPSGFRGSPAPVSIDVEIDLVAEMLTQGAADLDVQHERPTADLYLEGGDPVAVHEALCHFNHPRRLVKADHVTDAKPIGVAAEKPRHRLGQKLADQIPDRDIDGALGAGVADGTVQLGMDLLAVENVQPDDLRRKDALDHRLDAGLGFAIGEGARRGLGHAHQTVLAMDAHQHMFGHMDLARGEFERMRIGDGEGNCFDLGNLHDGVSPGSRAVQAVGRGSSRNSVAKTEGRALNSACQAARRGRSRRQFSASKRKSM